MTMKINTSTRVKRGFQFNPGGTDKVAFAKLEKEYATNIPEDLEFVRCVAFDTVAEQMQRDWEAGCREFVLQSGRLRTNEWLRADNKVQSDIEIVIESYKPAKISMAKRAAKAEAEETAAY